MRWVRRPSVTVIVAWAAVRFKERWAALLALAFVAAIKDVPLPHSAFGSLFTLAQAVAPLLCTAAIVLVVIQPPGARALDAAGEALNAAPRLVFVKIATAILPWLMSLAVAVAAGGLRNGTLAIVFWLLTIPLTFVCQIAFVGAAIERTGPISAIADAFRRARQTGLPVVVGLAILLALIERGPAALFTLVANAIFPPPDVPWSFPTFPGVTLPHAPFPVMMQQGEFGSAIPWSIRAVIAIANVPFFAFATVLYAGAALSFADTDPQPIEAEESIPAES